MDTTSIKLDNVCQHGFWVGQGAAPCPFCHPECYANGTQGTIAPLITVNVNTIFDAVKAARIAALESSLAERERECERMRGELAGSDVNVRELWARAESAESALKHALEEAEESQAKIEEIRRVVAEQAETKWGDILDAVGLKVVSKDGGEFPNLAEFDPFQIIGMLSCKSRTEW